MLATRVTSIFLSLAYGAPRAENRLLEQHEEDHGGSVIQKRLSYVQRVCV